MPGLDQPLNYATPRPAGERRQMPIVRLAFISHLLASYAVAMGFLGVVAAMDRSPPDTVTLTLALAAPLFMPIIFLGIAHAILAELNHDLRPLILIFAAPYVVAFALLFWWLVRRERRRQAASVPGCASAVRWSVLS